MASVAAMNSQTPWTTITGRRRLLAGLVLAVSNFMVVLDLTIANVSVPHIAGNLGITLDQGTWIISSYAVAEAICVPLTGWLAMRFGTVRVFIAAMFGFGVFSLLCGSSVSLGMLVVCRVGQGLCGGPIMPMSQALMMRVFPPEQRGMAMGAWAMTVILGPALGPIIGGWISDDFSWHWIFLINVPIAIACIAAAWVLLRPMETATNKVPIDRIGLALMVFWIGSLQMVLDLGRDRDWFGDWQIVALAIMAAIGFLAFVIWELTEEHPVVDLRIFRHRGFSASLATMCFGFGAFFAGMVVIPQWLQASLGYTAKQAGTLTAMHAFAGIIAAPFCAKLVGRYDARLLTSLGLGWMAICSLFRAQWEVGVDWYNLAWPLFVMGLGAPFMMIPLTAVNLSSVRPDEVASASGMQNFVRTMAIAISTASVLTIWSNAQRGARNDIVETMRPDAMSDLAATGMNAEQTRAVMSGMVESQAVMLAVNHTFYVAAAFLAVAASVVWLAPRHNVTNSPMPMH
jgi:MFS transporter, DHA2 family, multidrug resistance protein